MSPEGFDALHADMIEHMQGRDYFVQDLIGGLIQQFQSTYAWYRAGMAQPIYRHLLRRPERAELDSFIADFTVINCPSFQANPEKHNCRSETVIAMNFDKKLILIGGTEYAGETKNLSSLC